MTNRNSFSIISRYRYYIFTTART